MMVMIDPTNVRGAFTGGSMPQQQIPQDQPTAPTASVSQPATVSNTDALAALESLVAESAQVPSSTSVAASTPTTSSTTPPTPHNSSVGVDATVHASLVSSVGADPVQQTAFDPQMVLDQQVQASQVQLPQEQLQPDGFAVEKQQVVAPADPTAQAVLAAAQALPDTLNPPNPAPASAKETFERPAAPDAASIDVGGAVQQVEVERNPELPVEVEGFLQRVQDFSAQPPQEVVIADGTNEQATTNYPARPVIVLPITEEEEKKGKRKNPRNSIRWLVEWSHKVIKMFAGKVIYRHVDQE